MSRNQIEAADELGIGLLSERFNHAQFVLALIPKF